jgi:hypothetical protein
MKFLIKKLINVLLNFVWQGFIKDQLTHCFDHGNEKSVIEKIIKILFDIRFSKDKYNLINIYAIL